MYTRIKRADGKFNFSNQNSLIGTDWFYYADSFKNGFAYVEPKSGFWNLINEQGELISKENFIVVKNRTTPDLSKAPYKVKRKNGLWNFINQEGMLISKRNFFKAENFENGLAIVSDRYGFWNFIDTNGNLVSYDWFLDE
ncbi:MAG: hypothetical protein PHP54_05290 [Clostridia bacterium]|nr:hypothetical protein [Clostridia bacterium]